MSLLYALPLLCFHRMEAPSRVFTLTLEYPHVTEADRIRHGKGDCRFTASLIFNP